MLVPADSFSEEEDQPTDLLVVPTPPPIGPHTLTLSKPYLPDFMLFLNPPPPTHVYDLRLHHHGGLPADLEAAERLPEDGDHGRCHLRPGRHHRQQPRWQH